MTVLSGRLRLSRAVSIAAAWDAALLSRKRRSFQQILDGVLLLLKLLQRRLELLLTEGVELQAVDDREVAPAVGAAWIAEHEAGRHAVLALRHRGDADPVTRRRRLQPGFDVIEG